MVDRRRRDQFAEILRHFAAGLLTNVEYEKRVDDIFEGMSRKQLKDLALSAVWENVWFLYDDMSTHRLRDSHALPPEAKTEIARWIMFLYTDEEYQWPNVSFISLSSCLLSIVTLGLWDLIFRPYRERKFARHGNRDVWPFLTTQEFEESRRKPHLLHRAASS